MKPADRHNWLYEHIASDPLLSRAGVDILNSDFVDAYIEATKAPFIGRSWGAFTCPQLGKDLRDMWKAGKLKRSSIGLSSGAWQPGFPKWVWSYSIR